MFWYHCYLQLKYQYKYMKIDNDVKINSADKVRLERFDEKTIVVNDIYENILLSNTKDLTSYISCVFGFLFEGVKIVKPF